MWLLLLVVFVSMAYTFADGAGKPNAKLTVKVYNYAKVSGDTLVHGEDTAAWIFRRGGIELSWIDCPTSAEDVPKFPKCEQLADPLARTVKLLPRSMSEKFDLPPAKFGFALRPNEAFVFFDRVLEVTKDTGFSRPRVLGHLIAYELGHLFLEGERHSTGIMSANVLARDCERPGVMLLVFTKSQSKRMQAQLQREILPTK
jgi:hypothetical protein